MRYKAILNQFFAAQPTAVNVSPDGKYILTKAETNRGFNLSILDAVTKTEVAFATSKNTQLELTWRPDSKAVVFQEICGMERPLFLFDIETGRKTKIEAPVSHTALPSLRWNASGSRLACFEGDWQTGTLWAIDPEKNTEPTLVADRIACHSDFIWSPDGKYIAFTTESRPGILTIVDLFDLTQKKIHVLDGEVRNPSWAPNGTSILVSARGSHDEFFKLFSLNVQRGTVAVQAEANGDISQPLWMPDSVSFIYHVNTNGIIRAFLASVSSHNAVAIGPTNGVLTISHINSSGKTGFAHFSGLTSPPVVGCVSLPEGCWTDLYSCPMADRCRCPEPEFVSLKSRDGTVSPAYVWRAQPLPERKSAALIVVHGGLHTQTFPTWEAYINVVTGLGCNIVAVNHRGSTGVGKKHEELEGDPVWDILAARDYAENILEVESRRIFMTGISTGSRMIALAAARDPGIGGLVLVSWPGCEGSFERKFAEPFPVLEFHGDLDVVMSPKAARNSVQSFFPKVGQTTFNVHYWTFKDEGHFFYRSDSRAVVYSELSKLIQPAD